MSFGGAIKQREEMIVEYKRMLENETNLLRIEEINKQIALCEDQIGQLKTGKPFFGKPKPLVQTTTIIEPDPETKGQKVTVINPPVSPIVAEAKPSTKKIGNQLRKTLKEKSIASAEDSLKAKILAAKAAKTISNDNDA